jgi:predicted permease
MSMIEAITAANRSKQKTPELVFYVVCLNEKLTVVCKSFFNSQFSRGVEILYSTL